MANKINNELISNDVKYVIPKSADVEIPKGKETLEVASSIKGEDTQNVIRKEVSLILKDEMEKLENNVVKKLSLKGVEVSGRSEK